MRILLTAINAKYIHSNLAVYSLKASAGELSPYVELAEFTINHRTEEILREIYKKDPKVLLFSCYIWNIRQVKELVRECKKLLPQVPIWLGGPEVSFCACELLEEYPELTGILTGEGEESFRLLTECYVTKAEKWGEIPGAVYRRSKIIREGTEEKAEKSGPNQKKQQEELCVNRPGEPLALSGIPFAYKGLTDFEHRIIYYESSRGCPFSCSYCLSSVEKQVRFRDLEQVFAQLQYFLDAKAPQVKFVDRTFNCSHSHALAIWKYLSEHDNGVTNFHFEIGADLLNEEELALLEGMRPGLVQLEIGVQSVNQKTLKAIHRKTDLEKLRANVERIRRAGNIHQHLDLIAGLPYEDYTSFAHSFDTVFAMRPEQLQLGFLKLLQGSPMYREAKQYGIVCREQPPYEVLYTDWLSFSDILQLKAIEEMVEIYYNSHQFRYTLERLLKTCSSPFRFFEELADFYEKKDLNAISHSRLQRYEILLDYIRERHPGEEAVYRELLTIDLYLREKVKGRPAFASDQRPFEDRIRQILKQVGKQRHVEVLLEQKKRPVYLIFDYEKRNPLTKDADTWQWIDAKEEE